MWRKIALTGMFVAALMSAAAQGYSYAFGLEGLEDTMLYAAAHRADGLRIVDSARRGRDGQYRFEGKRVWPTGIYALVRADGTTPLGDFAVEGERKFAVRSDARFDPAHTTAKGSAGNSEMFAYEATVNAARQEMKAIQERQKQGDGTAQADLDSLRARMGRFEQGMKDSKHLYVRLVNMMADPEVPEGEVDAQAWYRMHYWDGLAGHLAAEGRVAPEVLTSPQLFNRMNYFFFGYLYYAESDTICAALDRLMALAGGDTAFCRLVLEYITPKYFRSTRNIGWDAVWCHIAGRYYLAGRCPWASEGTIYNMRKNYQRISQSIIGAHGQELWMIDTTQIDEPGHWQSSHRQRKPYVVLWFWDPDCHHCQQYTAELKALYDSLPEAERKFEVYAVGYESDVDKWKRYVREHELPFVNVGGPNVNIDYQEAYNVHGAPTMIILDPRRDIIMNKVIPISNLCRFIDEHEAKLKNEN